MLLAISLPVWSRGVRACAQTFPEATFSRTNPKSKEISQVRLDDFRLWLEQLTPEFPARLLRFHPVRRQTCQKVMWDKSATQMRPEATPPSPRGDQHPTSPLPPTLGRHHRTFEKGDPAKAKSSSVYSYFDFETCSSTRYQLPENLPLHFLTFRRYSLACSRTNWRLMRICLVVLIG